MKNLRKGICALVATMALGTAASAQFSVAAIARDSNMSALEAAAAIVLADRLGLDVDFIVSSRRSAGVPIFDLAPAYVLYRETRVMPVTIWKRKKGRGWGVIAKEMGVHPGAFNQARQAGYPIERWIWIDSVQHRYGWDYDDWRQYSRNGWDDRDIVGLAYYSRGNPVYAKEIAQDWSKHKDWKVVMNRGGKLPSGKVMVASKSSHGSSKSKGPSKVTGNSGKSKGSGKVTGGSSKGKGSGKTTGASGKGKGGGKVAAGPGGGKAKGSAKGPGKGSGKVAGGSAKGGSKGKGGGKGRGG